jgi:protein O-GlcNAc transferase
MNRKLRRAARKLGEPAPAPASHPQLARELATAADRLREGRLAEAAAALRRALALDPRHATSLHRLGLIEYQLGNAGTATDLIERSLRVEPRQADALSNLSAILRELGQTRRALALAEQAIAIAPGHAQAHSNLGNLLREQGRLAEAVRAHATAVGLDPRSAISHANLANALLALSRTDEALAACEQALALQPELAEAHAIRGQILQRLQRHGEALSSYQRALALKPALAALHTEIGNSLRCQGRFEEAVAAHRRTIAALPGHADAHGHLAVTLQGLGFWLDALAAYETAIRLAPGYVEAHSNLGVLLQQMGRAREAIAACRAAVALNPRYAAAHYNLGNTLQDLGRFEEAIHAYRQALACDPDMGQARFQLCNPRRQVCDWPGLEDEEAGCLAALDRSGVRVPPFATLMMSPSPAVHLAHARTWARGMSIAASAVCAPRTIAPARDRPIRLGYLSCDFHRHATARLIVELIEKHDRRRFSVTGYCFSPEDDSHIRKRVLAAFDHCVPIHELSHAAAARQIHADAIDILVDLKGYTKDARTEILAHRPAPVQVNFLGYPGSMGAGFIDYVIADDFVAPMQQQSSFTEKIVHLPHSYQPNDRLREIAARTPSRAECGLPEQGFVFASFNSAYKTTAQVFDRWMRLLGAVPESVLWLLDSNALAKTNLRREALALGIDPGRLVFAPKLRLAEHLARHGCADLFLDTLPVNAHTTASDALWAGLPVVTCAGEAFVARVAGSLLRSVGLSELITFNLDDYEALALRLARDPGRLADIRARLQASRSSAPLFDATRYARDLETAFIHMLDLHAAGRPSHAFAVADIARENRTRACS